MSIPHFCFVSVNEKEGRALLQGYIDSSLEKSWQELCMNNGEEASGDRKTNKTL